MYTIDADNILKFVTSEFIPVLANSLVKSAASQGSIDTIVVENAGTGYNNGTYTRSCSVTIQSTVVLSILYSYSSIWICYICYYDHCWFYVFTFGTVDVSLIPNIGSGTLASLDVVIPPNGGHGSDAAELGSYRLMFL